MDSELISWAPRRPVHPQGFVKILPGPAPRRCAVATRLMGCPLCQNPPPRKTPKVVMDLDQDWGASWREGHVPWRPGAAGAGGDVEPGRHPRDTYTHLVGPTVFPK